MICQRHNKVRKIKNLFDKCIDTYRMLKNMHLENINPVVNITVSEENCDKMEEIYRYFTKECGIDSLKACIVRDEGIYKTPRERRKRYMMYVWLTEKINAEIKTTKLLITIKIQSKAKFIKKKI